MGQSAEIAGLSGEATLQNAVTGRGPSATAPLTALIPSPRPAGEGMRLVVSRGPDKGVEIVLSLPVTVIGRHRDCDIVVDDVTASRYHAELEVRNGRCVLVDGGSLNGTFVNRRPVECVELSEGDEIWVGTARFTFHAGPAVNAQR
ncbi:FHA domain-containing protein [Saccharopolyspora endophytica]|uniref:FHA domain-containing protein n=1 Tax=Saccharopolyspora endophytica TaxID=543886 RepID=A0ABS5DLD7_9PSEU|nr:FHA domain-containing protein [Saccharopolyspora endophytica]MBQ0927106.1 FHA domain-containing protein [Saccharopolyspora endophytica]